MNVHLSFVIPALNEAAYIAQAITSIRTAMDAAQEQPAYEIIVADDDSADTTVEIAERHGARVVRLRKRNIAAVRNAGALQAQGEYLIFVDADTRVTATLLHEAVQAFERGAAWGTACAVAADRCPLWARFALVAYNFFHVRWKRCAYGFFFLVTRDAFAQTGGFPEQTAEGEDTALSKLLFERYGRPTVLRARVATSARKAHHFGFWYHLKMAWLTVRYGDAAYTRPEINDYRDGDLRLP